MSVEALVWAMYLAPVPVEQKGRGRSPKTGPRPPQPSAACAAVLIVLAEHASPDGRHSFPSVDTIMVGSRLGERTVRDCLDRLEADGVIHPGDPAMVAVAIKNPDRRPQIWDLAMDRVRTDLTQEQVRKLVRGHPILAPHLAPLLVSDGAAGGPGSSPDRGAVISGQGGDRGAVISDRGAVVSGTPEMTAPEPPYEPKTEPNPSTSGTAAAVPDQRSRPDVDALCALMADLVEGNGSKRPTITQAWRDQCRLMLDKDVRDPAKAAALMRWTAQDPFWCGVVLSLPKFRAKYDQLRLRALAEHEKRKPQRPTTDDRVQQTADNLRDIARAMTDGYGTMPLAIEADR